MATEEKGHVKMILSLKQINESIVLEKTYHLI